MEYEVRVTIATTDGLVVFNFTDKGVLVSLAGGSKALISWSEWEFIAGVHGKRRDTT